MNLNKFGYQSDVNSRHNISAIVLRLPKYLRSEWAKEANNLRGQSKEPNFAALTKFVVNKAKLANTEYGRLVNVKNDWDRNKPKSYGKPTKNVAAYQVSSRHQNEEQDGKRNPVMKSTCIFCRKDGHSLGRCFMFQENHTLKERDSSGKRDCAISVCRRGTSLANAREAVSVSLMDAVDDIIHCFILPN